jgi:hypothetical protein
MAALGRVHRHAGPARQRVGISAMGRMEGDADAGRHVHGLPLHMEGTLQRTQDGLRHQDLSRRVGSGQDHGDLVAPEPGDGVGAAQQAVHAPANLLQQQVAIHNDAPGWL